MIIECPSINQNLEVLKYSVEGIEPKALGVVKRAFGGDITATKIGDDITYTIKCKVDTAGKNLFVKMNGLLINVSDWEEDDGEMLMQKLKLSTFNLDLGWYHVEFEIKRNHK